MMIRTLFLLMFFTFFWRIAISKTLYVHNGSSNGNASSWSQASNDLKSILDNAKPFDTIWVAEGTYYPTAGTRRNISFIINEGVAVLGGFKKGANSLTKRDWKTYKTVLSGDIGKKNDSSDNSYHILKTSSVVPKKIKDCYLDGFTFIHGQADSSSGHQDRAGAIYIDASYMTLHITNCVFIHNYGMGSGVIAGYSFGTITNCIFQHNRAEYYGVGDAYFSKFYNCTFDHNSALKICGALRSKAPEIVNCRFTNNQCKEGGGALYASTERIYNCYFENNKTDGIKNSHGGAIYLLTAGGLNHIENCTFINNSATGDGGAIYSNNFAMIWRDSILICGSMFNGNNAKGKGGAIFTYGGSFFLANSVFMHNKSAEEGSVIYQFNKYYWSRNIYKNNSFYNNESDSNATIYFYNSSGTVAPELVNCILINNDSLTFKTPLTSPIPRANISLKRCIIDFDFPASDTIQRNPQFLNPNGPDGTLGTADDHLRLKWTSPGIDSGLDTTIKYGCGNISDIDGNPRVVDKLIDIGAYEKTDCSKILKPQIWTSSMVQCLGDSFTIQDSIPTTGIMTWHAEPGIDIPESNIHDPNITVSATKTGLLKIWRIATLCDSFTADTLIIQVQNITRTPTINKNTSKILCEGDTIQLSSAKSHSQYKWSTGSTSRSAQILTNTEVFLQVKDFDKCWSDTSKFQSITFETSPRKPSINSSKKEACASDSISLEIDTSSVGFQWSNGQSTKQFFTSKTGNFSARIIDHHGCFSQWSDTISVLFWDSLPRPNLVFDTLKACQGDSIEFRPDVNYPQIEWHNKDSSSNIYIQTNTTVFYRYSDTNACWSQYSKPVNTTFRTLPIAEIIDLNPTEFCAGDSISLYAKPIVKGKYFWSISDSTLSVVVRNEGWVFLQVEDEFCSSNKMDSIFINELAVPEAPILSLSRDTICKGDMSIATIKDPLNHTYRWNDGIVARKRQITNSLPLTVLAESVNGCTGVWSDTIKVQVNPLPEKPDIVITEGKTILCDGDSCILSANPIGMKYNWNNPGLKGATITVKNVGSYAVKIIDSNKCVSEASDTIKITLIQVPSPQLDSSGFLSFCFDDSVKIDVETFYDQYVWSDGFNNKSRTIYNTEELSVYGILEGCTSTSKNISTLKYQEVDQPEIKMAVISSNCNPEFRLYIDDSVSRVEWNIKSEGKPELTVTEPGEYTIRFMNNKGCWSPWSTPYILSETESISFANAELTVFPNPTVGHAAITTNSEIKSKGDVNLQLYDALGRLIFSRNMGEFNCEKFEIEMDLTQLKMGQYFINLKDNSQLLVLPITIL